MENRIITCIACPNGCELTVKLDNDGKIAEITGNKCKNGIPYAEAEVTMPTRILTSSVTVENGDMRLVSVKTSAPVPKAMLLDIMKEVARARVSAPVKVGDVIIKDVLGTGADIVATANVN